APSAAPTKSAAVNPVVQPDTLHAQDTDTTKVHDSRPMTERIKADVVSAAAVAGDAVAGMASHLRGGSHDTSKNKDTIQSSAATTTTTGAPSTVPTKSAAVKPVVQPDTLHGQDTDTTKAHGSRPMTEKIKADVIYAAAVTGDTVAGVASHLRGGPHDTSKDKETIQPRAATSSTTGAPSAAPTKSAAVNPVVQPDTLQAQGTDTTKAHASRPITEKIKADVIYAAAVTGDTVAGVASHLRGGPHDTSKDKSTIQPSVATTTTTGAPSTVPTKSAAVKPVVQPDTLQARGTDTKAHGSRPVTERIKADVIAAAAVTGDTVAGVASHLRGGSHDTSKDKSTIQPSVATSSTREAPSTVPTKSAAVKPVVQPDTLQTQDTDTTKVHGSRPVTERIKADVVSAAAVAGDTVAGVASHLRSGPHGISKDKDTIQPSAVTTTATETPSAAPTKAHDSRPMTEKIKADVAAAATAASDTVTGAASRLGGGSHGVSKDKGTIQPSAATTTAAETPSAAPAKAHDSHPVTEKIKADVIYAAAVTGGTVAGVASHLRGGSHDTSKNKDTIQPGAATTFPEHEHSLGELLMGYIGGYGPANPRDLPLTDPKTLSPLNLDIHEIVSEEAERRRKANEHRHMGLMQRIMDAITNHHNASEYGPADTKDLSLTDPKTLKPISAASLASTAPTTGMTKAPGVMDTGVKDRDMAPTGVPTSSVQADMPASKTATTESHPSGLKTAAATGAPAAATRVAAHLRGGPYDASKDKDTIQPSVATTTTTGAPSTVPTKSAAVKPAVQPDTLHGQDTDATKVHDSRPMTEKIKADVIAAAAVTGGAIAGVASHLRGGPHDASKDKDKIQPSAVTTTAAGTPGTSNVVGEHEHSLGQRLMGYVSGHGPADPRDLPLTDPKTLSPLNLDVHEAVSKEAERRRKANEHHHTSLMQQTMDAVAGHRIASEYGPADNKDLSLTDPKTLKPISAASLASTAPTTGMTKAP
ncbi:hypothetical protein BGZ51_009741, partial [Haplosporangium sp. Z 767]